ncbi:hypothetical protein V498_06871 [Pseudogymnoascus sp. VKM F-4517 (FW-2822)]|nr:hypothetical protein V498_06871 [Pseudogymnoascus sp. VKM F-4517 (FW-2822)]
MGKTIRDHAAEASGTKEVATSEVLHSCGVDAGRSCILIFSATQSTEEAAFDTGADCGVMQEDKCREPYYSPRHQQERAAATATQPDGYPELASIRSAFTRAVRIFYGLIEDEFAGDDFQLLVVYIFLNKTKGDRAIPAARRLLLHYTKPEMLANASYDEIKMYFRDLGLLRRCLAAHRIIQKKKWPIDPPQAGKIRKKMWGGSIQAESEVAHLQGGGLYASNAWRVLCKDNMYEKAGMKGTESEWKTVKPMDKKLRSYLIWRWARETGVAIERSLEGSDCDLGMSCLYN